MKRKPRRVLAISSGGGHWVQMLRLLPAFTAAQVTFASVGAERARDVAPRAYVAIPDANRARKWALIAMALRIGLLLLRLRPHVVISTGAAPGCIAIFMARLMGARTLFIDSVANAERLSLSARLVRRHADLTLTQWPDVASQTGCRYMGAVL